MNKKTENGILDIYGDGSYLVRRVSEINPAWSAYDKSVAECHLSNYGMIFLDNTYGNPIDNEYEQMDIADYLGI